MESTNDFLKNLILNPQWLFCAMQSIRKEHHIWSQTDPASSSKSGRTLRQFFNFPEPASSPAGGIHTFGWLWGSNTQKQCSRPRSFQPQRWVVQRSRRARGPCSWDASSVTFSISLNPSLLFTKPLQDAFFALLQVHSNLFFTQPLSALAFTFIGVWFK